jgi:hypothetical protein
MTRTPREALGRVVARQDSDMDLGLAEHRVFARDDDIGQQGEFVTTGDTLALRATSSIFTLGCIPPLEAAVDFLHGHRAYAPVAC